MLRLENGAGVEGVSDKIICRLDNALQLRDADEVERAIEDAYKSGLSVELVLPLLALLPETFHSRHEDIVGALQQLQDPRAVDAIYEAALVQHDYLDYDENFGLARKCSWALADIGTTRARFRLQMLAQNSNLLIAAYAQKRLDNWNRELDRKGTIKS